MAHALKELLESGLLDEASKAKISEAWDQRLAEVREEAATELREEFSARYDNDKAQLVEAMDSMLKDTIEKELREFNEDRKGLIAERVSYRRKLKEHSKMLNTFVKDSLVNEVKELREDRNSRKMSITRLEEFTIKQLSEEVTELNEDRQSLSDAKVKVLREGKAALAKAKTNFIKRSAKIVETAIGSTLRSEMSQLREDIEQARNNNFGRKIFESFAAEYITSFLSENSEIRGLMSKVTDQKARIKDLNESLKTVTTKSKLMESRAARAATLNELMAPLSKDKKALMMDLLEGVSTPKLKGAFKRYLPAVLNEAAKVRETAPRVKKKVVTGNRVLTESNDTETVTTIIDDDILSLKKLAGL